MHAAVSDASRNQYSK